MIDLCLHGKQEKAGKKQLASLITEGMITNEYLEKKNISSGTPEEKGELLLEYLKKNDRCLIIKWEWKKQRSGTLPAARKSSSC